MNTLPIFSCDSSARVTKVTKQFLIMISCYIMHKAKVVRNPYVFIKNICWGGCYTLSLFQLLFFCDLQQGAQNYIK